MSAAAAGAAFFHNVAYTDRVPPVGWRRARFPTWRAASGDIARSPATGKRHAHGAHPWATLPDARRQTENHHRCGRPATALREGRPCRWHFPLPIFDSEPAVNHRLKRGNDPPRCRATRPGCPCRHSRWPKCRWPENRRGCFPVWFHNLMDTARNRGGARNRRHRCPGLRWRSDKLYPYLILESKTDRGYRARVPWPE